MTGEKLELEFAIPQYLSYADIALFFSKRGFELQKGEMEESMICTKDKVVVTAVGCVVSIQRRLIDDTMVNILEDHCFNSWEQLTMFCLNNFSLSLHCDWRTR